MDELIVWMAAGLTAGLLIGFLIGPKLVKWETEYREKRLLEKTKAKIKAKYGYDGESWEEYNVRAEMRTCQVRDLIQSLCNEKCPDWDTCPIAEMIRKKAIDLFTSYKLKQEAEG